MSMTLEELRVVINAELGPFNQKMKQLNSKVSSSTKGLREQSNNIKNMFSGIGKYIGLAAIGAALYKISKYSIETALEVNASMNQIKRTMGESTDSFLKWADNNAIAFNMSKADAIKYGTVYSNLFSSFIKDTDKLSAYTAKMLETSSIIASGTGREMNDVMERIRSGLLGNTEAIEDLGIMVNVSMIESTEAFKKFANGQSWNQLDFQTQQQIRLMAILEQATALYGDTLESSVNNQIAQFKALMKDSALNIGNAFLPVIEAIMPILNAFARAVRYATGKLSEFIQLLFNKKVSSKDGLGSAVEGVSKGLGKAGDSAKGLGDGLADAGDGAGGLGKAVDGVGNKAKKAAKELRGLMGFDEINLLNKKDENDDAGSPVGVSGGGKGKGGSGGFKDILPDLDITDRGEQYNSMFDGLLEKLQPLKDFLEHLWNLFKLGWTMTFRAEGVDRITEALKGIKESILDIFSDGLVASTAGTFLERLAYALGQTVGAIGNVVLGVGVFITESLNKSLQETKLDIKSWLMRSFLEAGDIVSSMGNVFADLSDMFYDIITSKPSTDIGANIISTLSYAFMGVLDVSWKFGRDVWAGLEKGIHENKQPYIDAYVGILKGVEPVFRTLKEFVRDSFRIFNKVYDEHIKPFVDSFFNGVSKITKTLLDGWNTYINPVLEKLGNKFHGMYESHIKPAMESFGKTLGVVIDILRKLWENLLVPFLNWIASTILPILAPIIEYIETAVMGVVSIISDVITLILDLIRGLINIISGVLTGDWKQVWEGIKDIFVGVWDFITNFLSTVWNIIKTAFSTGFDLLLAIISGYWEGVKLTFQLAFDFILGVFSPIIDFFKFIWESISLVFSIVGPFFKDMFSTAWNNIVNIFKSIGQWFNDRWTEIKNFLEPVAKWFTDKFKNAWDSLTNIFKPLGNWFGDRWKDVTNTLSSVANWFGDIFTKAYNAVKNAFSSIGSFFSGVWNTVKGVFVNAGQQVGSAVGGAFKGAVNAVLGTIENIVNGFISMINGAISIINKLPGVSIGSVGTISLPRLARGGIVDSPTVAMIGEAGKEVVMPLENTGFLQTMGRVVGGAVVNALGSNLSNNQTGLQTNGDIVIQIGSTEFGRFAIKEINAEQERVGMTLLKI